MQLLLVLLVHQPCRSAGQCLAAGRCRPGSCPAPGLAQPLVGHAGVDITALAVEVHLGEAEHGVGVAVTRSLQAGAAAPACSVCAGTHCKPAPAPAPAGCNSGQHHMHARDSDDRLPAAYTPSAACHLPAALCTYRGTAAAAALLPATASCMCTWHTVPQQLPCRAPPAPPQTTAAP